MSDSLGMTETLPQSPKWWQKPVLNLFPSSHLIVWLDTKSAWWKHERAVDSSAHGYEGGASVPPCQGAWRVSACTRGPEWDGGSKAWRWNFLETKSDFTFEEATSSPHNSQPPPQWPGRARREFPSRARLVTKLVISIPICCPCRKCWSFPWCVGRKGAGVCVTLAFLLVLSEEVVIYKMNFERTYSLSLLKPPAFLLKAHWLLEWSSFLVFPEPV